jgi:tetratricopeptide (TPR) repeat protein
LSILEVKPDDPEAQRALKDFNMPPSSRGIAREASRDVPKTIPAMEFPPSTSFPSPDEMKPFDDKSDLFPSSVIRPQISPGADEIPPPDKDSEMHYHLGIAYKEMELFDYAISEFELAASNPSIKFDCYIMLGSCFLEKGDNARAIQHFKEAAQIKGLTKEKLARLHFNLGLAYEASGMVSQAIETFHQALRLDQSFSEAQVRLQRLQQLHK